MTANLRTTSVSTSDILVISNAEAGDLDPTFLQAAVGWAAISISHRFGDVPRHTPTVIDVTQALSSLPQWQETIRSLCQAKVAFLDISNYPPGTMMLLGIRSVVRRGITITLRTHDGSLPWNIREIKPVELHHSQTVQEASDCIASILADAWHRFSTDPAYADLPVYDAIRSLPTGDHSRIAPTQQALVLCSFGDRHKNQNWLFIDRAIQLALARLASRSTESIREPAREIRPLDMHSTTLVGHALYDASRRPVFCIIEWTDWRPSVFFEFRAHLAAYAIQPSCLIEFEEAAATPVRGQAELLFKLFTPISYQTHQINDVSRVSNMMEQHVEAILETTAGRTEQASNDTYRIVVDEFESVHDQDPIPPPHVELHRSARALQAPPQYMGTPVLYSESFRVHRLAKEAALERLLAAWFYLTGRYTDDELRSTDSLRRELESIGAEILETLRDTGAQPLQRLLAEILDKIER